MGVRYSEVRAGERLRRPMTAMVAAIVTSLAVAVVCSTAGAATFGQIGAAWGSPGSGAGQLFNPSMLGVDPSTGTVYSGEETPDEKHFRIQQFSVGGEFKAKVELPSILKEGAEEKLLTMHGIAVDPVLHRIYLIEGCVIAKPASGCRKPPNITFGARRILVFSTEPSGSALVPASPATLSLPEGEETLYEPQAIAVDPSNHDLVILAEDSEEHTTLQRISSAGVAGARFVDTGNELRPIGKEATTIAVGPDGTTYTITGAPSAVGSKFTRAWRLPKDLSSAEKVPGFAEAAESEGWATGMVSPRSSPLSGGPQLAVSPDGGTLYWKESLKQADEEGEPDNVLVRAFSLEKMATSTLYGNGEASCLIQTSDAGIATTGEKLVVFDYGPEFGEGESPAFGDHVLTFGSGGSGCRAPVAKFTVNGSGEEVVTVAKGATVTFDASGSELLGAAPKELDWSFGDGSEEKVVESGEEPPKESTTHKFTSGGTYIVTLRMKLVRTETPTGDPLPATHAVKVPGSGTLQKLTVSRSGTGLGTVKSSPAGVECGGDCEQEYEEGVKVTLTPTAASGSTFTGWTGACTGTSACEVTMSAAKSVGAKFDPKPKFKLTVAKAGTGKGAVTSSPSGIDCRGDCEQEYEEGKVVTLTALVAEGSEFTGWSVGACASAEKCKVTMSTAKEVKATFTAGSTVKVTLSVSKSGTGAGTVTGPGINCGGDCEEKYPEGEVVTLTQAASAGSVFKGWTGCESEPEGKCKVTMSAVKAVSAKFDAKPKFKLTVSKSGTGAGTVTSSPSGINCGIDCEEEYVEGTAVTLSQSPSAGSVFKGWTGCESEPEGKCKVTMSSSKAVKAIFDSTVKFKLSVTKSGVGTGTVTSGDGQVNCGGDCEGEYEPGAKVTLTATASSGSEFKGWNGACSGTGACEVTMSAATVVGAEFAAISLPPPPEEQPKTTKKLTPLQKALKKCKKLKGKARAKCIKKAKKRFGRHKRRHALRGRGRG
jgi:hypothetical protein